MDDRMLIFPALQWRHKSVSSSVPASGASRQMSLEESSHSIRVFFLVPHSSSLQAACRATYISFASLYVERLPVVYTRMTVISACHSPLPCWVNYIIDATNFLEFLPTRHEWLVTFMGAWWAVGYMMTGFLAWGFMSDFSCASKATPAMCSTSDNRAGDICILPVAHWFWSWHWRGLPFSRWCRLRGGGLLKSR